MSSTYSGIRYTNVYVYQMQRYGFWYPSRLFLIFFQTLQQPWGKMGPIPTFFTKQARNPHVRWVHTGATNASLAISSSITQTEPAAHRVGMPAEGKPMSHARDEYSPDPKRQPFTVTMRCAEGVRTSTIYALPCAVPGAGRALLQSCQRVSSWSHKGEDSIPSVHRRADI